MHDIDSATIAVAFAIGLIVAVPVFLGLMYSIANLKTHYEAREITVIRTKSDVRLQAVVGFSAPAGWMLFGRKAKYVPGFLEQSLRTISFVSTADEIFGYMDGVETQMQQSIDGYFPKKGIKVCILKLEAQEPGLRARWNYFHKDKE